MAEMVFCQSCRAVIWAYDQEATIGMICTANMLQLPCPKCGELGNFSGYSRLVAGLEWLHERAKDANLTWEISPNYTWFRRPDMGYEDYLRLLFRISTLIGDK